MEWNGIQHKGMENKIKEDEKEKETSYSEDEDKGVIQTSQAGSSENKGTNAKDCGMHLTGYAVYCIARNAVGNFSSRN